MDLTGYPVCLGCGHHLISERDELACSLCGSTERRYPAPRTRQVPRVTYVATPCRVPTTTEGDQTP